MCLALDGVTHLFLGLCLLLIRKGREVYLGSQKFPSRELPYGDLLKTLVEILFFCLFGCFFLFCIWEPDHAFKRSQRSQENGKTAKIFVFSCGTLLGGEVDDCSDVSPAEPCSFGSSVWPCSGAGLLCPSVALREAGYGPQEENERFG